MTYVEVPIAAELLACIDAWRESVGVGTISREVAIAQLTAAGLNKIEVGE